MGSKEDLPGLHRSLVTHGGWGGPPGSLPSETRVRAPQVQVRGSVVYANHSVRLEVRARAPVGVIAEGTHLLVPRRPSATVVLHGALSYDPDWPGATLR